MGNSTRSIQDVIDLIAVLGDISPQANPSGYGPKVALRIANLVMMDLIASRFNWKWNSTLGKPFLTNTWQQDYPQIGLSNIGWGEDCFWVDINNSILPKPLDGMFMVRKLPPVSQIISTQWPQWISWDYNKNLNYGVWPGAGKLYSPLLGTTPTPQNGPMAFVDANGNILTLTTFGTTGNTAPAAPQGSIEGATVTDGSCIWTVVNPLGMGWRVWPLPPATGPVWQINPTYQETAVPIVTLDQMLDPIPDDYSQHFDVGFKVYCHEYSSNPADREAAIKMKINWLASMDTAAKQGDREASGYGLIPAARPVASVYGRSGRRNPMDPLRPY